MYIIKRISNNAGAINSCEMVSCKKRREEILKLIEEKGLWNINKTELGELYGVSRQMIKKDVDHIIEHYEPITLKNASLNIDVAYKKMVKTCQESLANATQLKNKLEIIKTLDKITQGQVEYMEKFGIKSIVPIPTDTSIEVTWGKVENEKEDEKKDD